MHSKFAQILSYIFHPLLIPVYAVLITFEFPIIHIQMMSLYYCVLVLSVAIVFGVLFPLLIIYFLKRKGYISSFYMENRTDRNLPYLVMFFSYMLVIFFIQRIHLILPVFPVIYLNAAVLILLIFVINGFFKISAHLSALGSLFMYLYVFAFRLNMDLLWWILGTLFISGLIAVARLALGAHTKLQVYAGFFLGAALTFSVLKLLFLKG